MIHFIRQSVLVKLLLFGSSCIYGCDPVFFPSCGTFVFSCVYLRLKAASDGFSFISFIHAFMKPRFLFVCLFWFFWGFFLCLFMATSVPYGGSQARGQIRAATEAYTTALATSDPSCLCDLHHSLQQYQFLNPLNEARDRTHFLMETMFGP